eukprot:Nk52_evm20s2377 gene=Nk52_evmTU20s2377
MIIDIRDKERQSHREVQVSQLNNYTMNCYWLTYLAAKYNRSTKKKEDLWHAYTMADMTFYQMNSFVTKVAVSVRKNYFKGDHKNLKYDTDCFATSIEEEERVNEFVKGGKYEMKYSYDESTREVLVQTTYQVFKIFQSPTSDDH